MRHGTAGSRTATAWREALGSEKVLTGVSVTAYRLGEAEPVVVVIPRDEADVSRVLTIAFEDGAGVVPWGGGAHQAVGGAPTRYDVALDLSHLDRVVAYEPADMTATVQAGVRLAALQQRLGEAGQCWPLDPPLADRATVGGVVAANLNGPLRCRYGTVRDLVLGVRVAHADGTITKAGARVVKNATAYDLTKLYAGSHGTLGVLLEATLRLQPRPAVERGWLLTGAPLERCHEVAMRILGSHLAPNRLELVDRTGAVGWGSPESDPALVVSFAGVREAVQDQGSSVTTLARESGVEAAEIQNAGTVCQALQDFPWRAPGLGAFGVRALWRGNVLSSDCAKAMHAVRDATSRFGEGAIVATVSHGALRGVLGASSIDDVRSGLAVAREALGALGGFLVVMDAPGPLRGTLNVWGPMPAEVALMRQIKMAFDPKGILNPGRFVDGI